MTQTAGIWDLLLSLGMFNLIHGEFYPSFYIPYNSIYMEFWAPPAVLCMDLKYSKPCYSQ